MNHAPGYEPWMDREVRLVKDARGKTRVEHDGHPYSNLVGGEFTREAFDAAVAKLDVDAVLPLLVGIDPGSPNGRSDRDRDRGRVARLRARDRCAVP